MVDPSPSPLGRAASSASPVGNSPRTPTGRPPRWNPSTERKVSRLYLYTTLPVQKIIDVVHAKSPDSAPGVDSAHKKLNALFDKQPRWLHPRTDSDMSRRLNELSQSPIRSPTPSSLSRASSVSRPHASSDPTPSPYLNLNLHPQSMVMASEMSPSLQVPPFHQYPAATPPAAPLSKRTSPQPPRPRVQTSFATPAASRRGSIKEQGDGTAFNRFLRQTTFMSSSTDHSTGSLRGVLAGYSEPYVRTVKRLVKRFTAPLSPRMNDMSPISEERTFLPAWVCDQDAPRSLANRPYYLPGDWLSLDQLIQKHPSCFQETEEHRKRSCLCYITQSQTGHSPWVTDRGLTHTGQWLLVNGINDVDLGARDEFNNTILHFLAARGTHSRLLDAIQSGSCDPILSITNTAGQTFLHVLGEIWFTSPNHLHQLLALVHSKKMDIYARDHYGRNVFHMLMAADASIDAINWILESCDRSRRAAKRDAFNVTPELHARPLMPFERVNTQAMDLDPPQSSSSYSTDVKVDLSAGLQAEADLLRVANQGIVDPSCEDARGRNALHCIAAATLSDRAVTHKHGIQQGRKEQETKNPDASTERLTLRLRATENLLAAGVDPNHYDSDGNTPLMAFAAQLPEEDDYKITPKILECLIKGGANVHARNRAGETALHIAVRCGRKLAMRTLVEKGANVHVRDADGRSVLEVADVKMQGTREESPKEYAHFEACRAWLSGSKSLAVQEPTLMQEWGMQSS